MQAIRIFFTLTILTGFIYPLSIAGIANIFFKEKAGGSIIYRENVPIGSFLLGQEFKSAGYFHGRPSASNYNANPSAASNQGPTSKDLRISVADRKQKLNESQVVENIQYPLDLLFASGSGLDPHISPQAAKFQVERISKARNFSSIQRIKLDNLIEEKIEKREYKILGEERVNVLVLNLELEKIK